MRALDPIVAKDNIRVAVIHPWFAGKHSTISLVPPPLTYLTCADEYRVSKKKIKADTAILGLPVKILLAGIPMLPIPRIAGAVFRAATDPDVATSGCPWVLPDDGPVIRVEKEALRAGVYEILDQRIRRAYR